MKAKPLVEGSKTDFLDEYEVIPPQAVASVQILMKMWETLGKPDTPFSESGKKLMNIIIAVWEDGYPNDARKWMKDRADYQSAEMPISEQVSKKTGRSLASYPLPIYNIMGKLFPTFKAADRKNCMKMIKLWPIFQLANKV